METLQALSCTAGVAYLREPPLDPSVRTTTDRGPSQCIPLANSNPKMRKAWRMSASG